MVSLSLTITSCGLIGTSKFALNDRFVVLLFCISRNMVQRADKMTGSRQSPLPYVLAHLGKPYDVVNVPEECPNLSNTCKVRSLNFNF